MGQMLTRRHILVFNGFQALKELIFQSSFSEIAL